MKLLKGILFILILTMGTFPLGGCSFVGKEPVQASPEEKPAVIEQLEKNPALIRDNVVVVAGAPIVGNFNPIGTHKGTDRWVMDAVFEGLLAYDEKGKLMPLLAETIERDESGLIYTVTLKPNVMFHNGTLLQVEDVLFTYSVLKEKGENDSYGSFKDHIENVSKVDNRTIQFQFKESDSTHMEFFTKGILPKDHYEGFFSDSATFSMPLPVGTGALVFESFTPADNITLNQFSSYHGKPSNVKRVVIKLLHSDAAISAYQEGQVDLVMVEPSEPNFVALSSTSFGKSQYFSGSILATLGINHKDPIVSDLNVRQALAYGLNREAFVRQQWFKESTPAYGPILEDHYLFPRDQAFDDYSYDIEKANQLLDAAGWVKADNAEYRTKENQVLKITLMAYNDVSWSYNLAVHAQKHWGMLGIQVEIDSMDFDALVKKVFEEQVGMMWTMAWDIPVHLNPRELYTQTYAGGYVNAALEDIFVALEASTDELLSQRLTADWLGLVNETLPMIYVANIGELWGVNNRVVGIKLNPYVSWIKRLDEVTLKTLE